MSDIPSVLTTAAATPTATTATPAVTPLQVMIADITQALETLTRIIETNATPQALTNGNMLQLATNLGSLTVTFPQIQQMSNAERQALLQQLTTLIETQRPLPLILQPGSPPSQGVLLIPTPPAPSIVTPPPVLAPPVIPPLPLPPLVVGDAIPALVLPSPALVVSSLLASAPQVEGTAVPTFIPSGNKPPEPPAFPPAATDLPPAPLLVQTPSSTQPLSVSVQASPAAAPPQNSQPPVLASGETPSPQKPSQAPEAPTPNSFIPRDTPSQSQLPQALLPLLQPGKEVVLRVDTPPLPAPSSLPSLSSTSLSSAPQPLAPPLLAPNQVSATVTGFGTNGHLILTVGSTTLFVKAQVSAPLGATMIVTVDAAKQAPLIPLPPPAPDDRFSALPQAIAALAQIDPQLLQQIMSKHIPQPTAALPGTLLFFLSAFKQGNVSAWLGNEATIKLMRAGKMDIIASLSDALASAGQIVQDSVVGSWRAYPLPLYAQEKFQPLALYVRRDDGDPQQGKSGGGKAERGKIRFLIDMRLSQLGPMQIDGFIQPKKFDVLLRSETPLPDGLHDELRSAYIKALDAVGYTGALNFQVGHQHWTRMQKEAPKGVVT